ncbi:MAG: adenosylmethionine--8-amino-7-oxononanoate transaminase [Alphaproteobacteria bacterium]
MNKFPEWMEYRKNVWHPYTQEKIVPIAKPIVSAEGVRMRLSDGQELIDGISSWWTMCHGHSHPNIKSAINKQLENLPHIMFSGLAHEAAYKLADKLIHILPKGFSKVFYSDSGSVAVEIALKIALQFYSNQDRQEKTAFISFKDGYHGDTLGAMSVSDNSYHEGFSVANPNWYLVNLPKDENSLNEFEKFIKTVKDKTAALIIEPLVQAAGGMKFHNAQILASIYKICKENEILFIADEIATGFGRTGSMFACGEAGITPDIICVGKALTGGFLPLAATIVTDEVYEPFYSTDVSKAFMHGPTFMGNALACSAAIASIELFESEPRIAQVKEIEKQLGLGLEACKESNKVMDVRVKGAIGVVEVDIKKIDIIDLREKFIKYGVWLRPFSNIIYVMPPFIISQQDLQCIIDAIKEEVR